MRDLYSWHLLSVGIWTGCIATEIFFEQIFQSNSKEIKTLLSKLHYYVDVCIELPISFLVFGTGLKLMKGRGGERPIILMSTFGTMALLSNFGCFFNVYGRYQAAITDNWESYERYDKYQHFFGKGVVHSVAAALGVAYDIASKN